MYAPVHDCYFIHIPKTGGKSICAALSGRTDHPRPKMARDHQAEDPDGWARRFSFAVVRNPWDKEVSNYLWHRRTPGMPCHDQEWTFSQYLRKPHFNPKHPGHRWVSNQLDWIETPDGTVRFVARFERLLDDWELICERIGSRLELPHENESVGRRSHRDYYDKKGRLIVARAYERDVRHFGYKF